jgi:dynein heavy chain, axonemal
MKEYLRGYLRVHIVVAARFCTIWVGGADWQERASGMLRLILIKTLREEKLLFAISEYAGTQNGPDFKEPPSWRLEDVFPDTTAHTPIILVLSTGADPTEMLQRFADSKGWAPGARLHMISLGQGQVCSLPCTH